MDSDGKKEQKEDDNKEQEKDSSKPESEEEESLNTLSTLSESEKKEDPSSKTDSAASGLSASSGEIEGACKIPEPGPYTSLFQRRRELGAREKDEDEAKHSCMLECNKQPREHGLMKENKDQQLKDRPVESSITASKQSESDTFDIFETEGACGVSDPLSSSQQESLAQRYQELSLLENKRERVLDREVERSPRRSSSMLEASLRASEGSVGLPGPFASFIQRHRDIDMDDNSDEEHLDDRPVWPVDCRQRETSASFRGSRSASLGECSEESMSRSTSEASHSSGLQENKEASASDSTPLQQEQQQEQDRELNPPEDEAADEGGATDEDEADLETEEHYPDSDSERKGYSL